MTFRNFPKLDETNAPEAARSALAGTKRAFGGIPGPLMAYANSPLALHAALGGLETFEKSSLLPIEREVLAMTMGRRNGCQFCIATHVRLLRGLKADPAIASALEAGAPLPDARLEALRQFVLELLDHHGSVPPATWTAFREAGYTHEQALELVVGVSVYTLTTLANRLTETSE
jgi:AhpD family alkylhydroperoxidase